MQSGAIHLQLTQLLQAKFQAEQDVRRYEALLRQQIDPNLDEADPGLTMQSVTMALLKNTRRKLETIKHALYHAEQGTYGICEVCGQPINPERLEIFPQATLCVSCKTKQERR